MANDFNIKVGVTPDVNPSHIQTELDKKTRNVKLNLELDKVNLSNRISSYISNNSKLSTELKNRLIDVQKSLKNVDNTELNTLKKSFRSITSEAQALGKVGDTAFVKLQKNTSQFLSYLGSASVIMTGVNSIRSLISTVSDLDKSLVNLQQATGFSNEQAKELLSTYIDLGQELGATGTEVANSADQWLRQGKSISETNELIRDSMILSKIGQIDSAQATQFLTSAMKGYKVEVSEVLGIVDKLSAIDLNSATSVSGLAEGMSRVANMADNVGVSMDKLLSYLATVGEVTQKDMSSIGEAFQTMFSRMGNIKIKKFVDDETGESLSDTESVLNKLGVTLRNTDGSFKNFGDVLDVIGGKWNSYTQVEQNALGVAISGVRQRENFTVLMNNYAKSLEYAGISAQSSGTAMKKFEAYEQSVESKTKTLQASLQELASDTLDSQFIKSFLDASNVLVNVTDDIGIFNIALASLLGLAGAKSGVFKTLTDQISLAMVAQTGYTAETTAAAFAQVGFTGAVKASTMAIKSFLLTNPIGWAVLAGTAIYGLVEAYDYFNVSLEENQDKLSELKGEYDSITSEVETLESQLSSIQDRMKELENTKPIDILEDDEYQKLSDSNDELQRRLTIQKELQKVAGREAEQQAVQTIDTKSETSLTKVEESYSNSGATRPALVTRTEAIQERIDAYKKLQSEIDVLEQKQLKLAEAGKTESKEYKNLTNTIEETTAKRDEYYSYIVSTMDVLNSESDSIVGATTKGTEYAETIDALGVTVDDFIASAKGQNDILTEVSNTTTEVANSSSNAAQEVQTLSEILDNLAKDNKLLTNVKDEIEEIGTISTNTVNDILSTYPELENAVKDYLAGKISEKELIESMQSAYETDYDAYRTAILDKQVLDEDFYDTIIGNLDENTTKLAEKYGIDLQNFANLQAAKLALAAEYQRNLEALQNTNTFNDIFTAPSLGNEWTTGIESDIANSAQVKVDDFKSIIDGMNSVVDGYIKGFVESSSDSKKGSSNTDKVELPEGYITDRADLEHRRNMGLSDKQYFKELAQLEKDYLAGHKEYQSEIWSIDEAIYDHRKQLKEQSIKDQFDSLDRDFSLGKIDEDDYYKQLNDLNEKYYKNNKDHADDYYSNLEKIYQHDKEVAEKALEDKQQAYIDSINVVTDAYDKLYSEIDSLASGSEDGSDTQINAYTDGVKTATNEVKYLQNALKDLETKYKDGKITLEQYTDEYDILQDQLADAKDAITDYQKAISEAIAARLEDQTKAIDEAYESEVDAMEKAYDTKKEQLEDELDAVKKIVDAKLEILEAEKEAADYAKDIADKNKDIASIQKRIAELTKAANSGDRTAKAELDKLNEDLADKQSDLAKTQADHEYELKKDALDKVKSDYEDLTENEIDKLTDVHEQTLANAKSEHEQKLADVESLYKRMMELMTTASQHTKTEFAKAISETNTQLNNLGAGLTDVQLGSLIGSFDGMASGGNSVEKVLGIYSEANKSADTSDLSALNKYVTSKGYGILTKDKMVKLAQALGLTDIDNANEVGTDELGKVNKKRILDALKSAGFKDGGIASVSTNSFISALTGGKENGIALVRNGEGFVPPEIVPDIKELLKSIKPLNNLVKLTTPNISNITTNNSSTPIITMPITINGNADSSTVAGLKSAGNDLVSQLVNAMRKS